MGICPSGCLSVQPCVHDDVIKWKHFPHYCPFCGEFTGEFPAQRPVTWSFDVFFHLRLNKRLSKQPRGWWFETPPWSLLVNVMSICYISKSSLLVQGDGTVVFVMWKFALFHCWWNFLLRAMHGYYQLQRSQIHVAFIVWFLWFSKHYSHNHLNNWYFDHPLNALYHAVQETGYGCYKDTSFDLIWLSVTALSFFFPPSISWQEVTSLLTFDPLHVCLCMISWWCGHEGYLCLTEISGQSKIATGNDMQMSIFVDAWWLPIVYTSWPC